MEKQIKQLMQSFKSNAFPLFRHCFINKHNVTEKYAIVDVWYKQNEISRQTIDIGKNSL
ncbi:hypothetical protein VEE70_12880 [Escherichia coli]|nr:hypothetical protein VEGS01_12880 [Escherichia coli]BEC18006.1 hypothetical protein VEE70_12880 [Escherichia coli]